MAFIMLTILIAFTFFSYFIGKRNLLSPWFLLCLVFSATYLIVLINYNKWEVKINLKFLIYVTTAIIAFGIGCILVQLIKKPYPITNNNQHGDFGEDTILNTKYPVNLFIVLSLFSTIIYVLRLVLDAGLSDSFTAILRRIYSMQSSEKYSPGFIYNQMREVITAIAYLNTFRFLVRLNNKRDKISVIKLIIPIMLFLVVVMFSTERNFFLRYAMYFVCLWVFAYLKKQKKEHANIKIVVRVAAMLIVVILLFFLLGVTKQYTSSFFDQISVYCSSGLNNFNIWLEEYNGPLLFGKSTFTTLFDALNTIFAPFGVNSGELIDQIDPFTSYITGNGYHYFTNIYSALKPYVEDFGYFGVLLFPFIVGMFYQWLFLKAERSNYGLSWIIYSMLIYSIIYFPILEQLFRRFHLGLIYELAWISILYYLVFIKKQRKVAIRQTRYSK